MGLSTVYKCRKCGEEEIGVCFPLADEGIVSASTIMFDDKARAARIENPKMLHECKDGSFGICDLVGFAPTKD
jgi:hypothetical protein